MRNGSVLKKFIRPKAEPYQFPDDLRDETPVAPRKEEDEEDLLESFQDELFVDGAPRMARPPSGNHSEEPEKADAPKEPSPADSPVQFAKVQADALLNAARAEAEQMKTAAAAQARAQADKIRQEARQKGYHAGYAEGITGAAKDLKAQREAQAAKMEKQLQTFLDNFSQAQDELMDGTKADMRDLAIAVAEKVVRISLKSSSGVIAKMIQDATEKMKRREWVHIYVSDCDVKGLSQITPRLTRALSGLSDHIRIIPVAEEESGTCIIETPDTIIDASASTQMTNIRSMLENISPDDAPPRNFGHRPGDR